MRKCKSALVVYERIYWKQKATMQHHDRIDNQLSWTVVAETLKAIQESSQDYYRVF